MSGCRVQAASEEGRSGSREGQGREQEAHLKDTLEVIHQTWANSRILDSTALQASDISQLARLIQMESPGCWGSLWVNSCKLQVHTHAPCLDPPNPTPKPRAQSTAKPALRSPAWPSLCPTISARAT